MNNMLFDLNNLRYEISFKSHDELRKILFFYHIHNLYNINIPCKSNLKKEFLLDAIRISREEYPDINIIPHFSIMHEFRRSRGNTLDSFSNFLEFVKYLGCNQVLLISGSQKRSTLDSVSILTHFIDSSLISNGKFSIGVAFNPYLPSISFEQETIRLEKKLESGLVNSIWIQFGTDTLLIEKRIKKLKNIILSVKNRHSTISDVKIYGSVLIPSKQFLSRFKYRPWKGVYCSSDFLNSIEYANKLIRDLFLIYKRHNILPIIETNTYTEHQLRSLENILSNN